MRTLAILVCTLVVVPVMAASSGQPAAHAGVPSSLHSVVKRGRTVDVRFLESLRPRRITRGQAVRLEVASDVVADGRVVLREGAEVTGHIEELSRSHAAGTPARIDVVIDSAQAVDGQSVPLSGIYSTKGADRRVEAAGIAIFWCICGLLIPGEDVVVSEGTVVTCFVRQDTPIQVEESESRGLNESASDSIGAGAPAVAPSHVSGV